MPEPLDYESPKPTRQRAASWIMLSGAVTIIVIAALYGTFVWFLNHKWS